MRSRGGRDPCPWRESVTASSRASRAVSVGALLPGAPAAGAQLELAVVVEGLEPFEVREPIDSCERDSCIDGAASEGGAHETASAPSYTSPSALVWRPCRRAHAAARSMRPFVAVRAWRLRRPAHPSVPAARSPDRYRAAGQTHAIRKRCPHGGADARDTQAVPRYASGAPRCPHGGRCGGRSRVALAGRHRSRGTGACDPLSLHPVT